MSDIIEVRFMSGSRRVVWLLPNTAVLFQEHFESGIKMKGKQKKLHLVFSKNFPVNKEEKRKKPNTSVLNWRNLDLWLDLFAHVLNTNTFLYSSVSLFFSVVTHKVDRRVLNELA